MIPHPMFRIPLGTDIRLDDDERPRFLSERDCHAIADELRRAATGGGYTVVSILSDWTGNTRWARNQVISSGEVLNAAIAVGRSINGAGNRMVLLNDTDTEALVAAVRRAERLAKIAGETSQSDLVRSRPLEEGVKPSMFSKTTYDLDADHRSAIARDLAQSAVDAGMLSAGYVEVSAHSQALIDTEGRTRYFEYTSAQYSVTVRDPDGTGSGWAGVDWYDWAKIDGASLSKIALQKCLTSRTPVALEPGRYTAILEPQAVADLVTNLINLYPMERQGNESWPPQFPFVKGKDSEYGWVHSHLGSKMIDARLTISTDPMDPELGFPPFDFGYGVDAVGDPFNNSVYHDVTWFDKGVVAALPYNRDYGLQQLGKSTGLPMSMAFRMSSSSSGGTTSMDEMISSTKRGVLVTRFDRPQIIDVRNVLCRGYTRDGLWLVENGKISKAIKNFAFTESVLFALNNVEQIGTAQRVFHPGMYMLKPTPIIVPPLKIRDFSFTALTDAV